MALKKHLSSALNYASTTNCNGYEIEIVCYMSDGKLRLECGDDFQVLIPDQEIEIDSSGEASVVHVDDQGVTEVLNFEFRVSVPIRDCDFA